MLLRLDQLHQKIWDLLKGGGLLLGSVEPDVLDRWQVALAQLGLLIGVGKQKSLLGVVVAELKVYFLGLFEEPAVEVLLVVHLVEVKGILFVFEVRGLIFYLGLLVVLTLESPLALRPGLAIRSKVFLFSISLHINFGEALVLVIEIYGVLDVLVAEGEGIAIVILAEGALLGVEDILDGLVFEGW